MMVVRTGTGPGPPALHRRPRVEVQGIFTHARFQLGPSLKQTVPEKNENADNRKHYADQKN
jgi:hypothetical protein